jgi:hypothetical protein
MRFSPNGLYVKSGDETIYNSFITSSGTSENIAAKGTATQVDDWPHGEPQRQVGKAHKAIDGNTNSKWNSNDSINSISLTETSGAAAWWKLTFPIVYSIDSIVIWNRMDHYPERIDAVSVKVGEAFVGTVAYKAGQTKYHFVELGVLGRQITIEGSGITNRPVQLVEVEVFGGEVSVRADSKEVMQESASNIILTCRVRGISRKMKITWSGWDPAEQSKNFGFVIRKYEPSSQRQVHKLIIKRAAIIDDKTYTCTVTSDKIQPPEELSAEAQLLTYNVRCLNKTVLAGWSGKLLCIISGLSKAARVKWTLDSEVNFEECNSSFRVFLWLFKFN